MGLLLHDTNIFHKTNTSCYLAKEEATLKVIRLIVVKSAVKVSLTLSPSPSGEKPQVWAIRSMTSAAPGHWLQSRVGGMRRYMPVTPLEEKSGWGTKEQSKKKSDCGIPSQEDIKGRGVEENWRNKIVSTSDTNIGSRIKT